MLNVNLSTGLEKYIIAALFPSIFFIFRQSRMKTKVFFLLLTLTKVDLSSFLYFIFCPVERCLMHESNSETNDRPARGH
jgi:hypothetical protein